MAHTADISDLANVDGLTRLRDELNRRLARPRCGIGAGTPCVLSSGHSRCHHGTTSAADLCARASGSLHTNPEDIASVPPEGWLGTVRPVTRARRLLDRYGEDDPAVRRGFLRTVANLDRLPLYDARGYLDDVEAEMREIDAVVARAIPDPF